MALVSDLEYDKPLMGLEPGISDVSSPADILDVTWAPGWNTTYTYVFTPDRDVRIFILYFVRFYTPTAAERVGSARIKNGAAVLNMSYASTWQGSVGNNPITLVAYADIAAGVATTITFEVQNLSAAASIRAQEQRTVIFSSGPGGGGGAGGPIAHTALTDMPSAVNADHDGRYYTEAECAALFAAIANGVTGGNAHDHVGGDGATITQLGTVTVGVWQGTPIADAYVANDITLTNITQITNRSHTSLSDIGTNTHSVIDTHLASTANPHSTSDANLVTTDVITNNASITKHGFLKKLSNIATEYMDGTGAWSVPAGGGGGPHNLLSATHTDTLAAACVRGDLIVGDSTPAWARKAVGAAHSILWSDGTDISWQTAPEIQYIKDTGGTTRITTATAAPFVTATGGLLCGSAVAFGAGAAALPTDCGLMAKINSTMGMAGIKIEHGLTTAPGATQYWGLGGLVNGDGTAAAEGIYALNFQAYDGMSGAGGSLTNLVGIYVRLGHLRASTVGADMTNERGVWVARPINIVLSTRKKPTTLAVGVDVEDQAVANGTGTTAQVTGIRIQAMSAGTTATGLEVAMPTGGTTKYTIEAGGVINTTPYFRVIGGWTAAANQTPLYISEGVTPTLRQLKTFDPGNLGVNFTAGQLVAILV